MPKKSPKGRAGKKQKAQKSPGGKPPFGKQGKRDVYFDDDDDEPAGPSFRGFTQRSGDSTPGRAAIKLRHQAISFVSASPKPVAEDTQVEILPAVVAALADEDLDDSEDDEDEDDEEANIQTNIIEDVEVEISNGTQAMHIHETVREQTSVMFGLDGATDDNSTQPRKASTPLRAEAPLFVIDTVGDMSMNGRSKGKGKALVRPRSPSPSESSGDEVVFRGRNQPIVIDDPVVAQPKPQSRTARRPRSPQPVQQKEAHVTDELLKALGVSLEASEIASAEASSLGWAETDTSSSLKPEVSGWAKAQGWASQAADPSQDFKPVENGWWRKQKQGVPNVDLAASLGNGHADESASGAPETVEALRAKFREAIRSKKSKQKDTIQVQSTESTNRRGKRGRKKHNKSLRELNSDDSDEDMAACKDYLENLREQGEDVDDLPAPKSADAGPSLVVDGRVIGEDEVLDASTRDIDFSQLQSMDEGEPENSDDDIIGEDLSELDDDDGLNASDYDSSDLENDLEYDEQEQWEDEEDLRQRRRDQMTDETVARLLQKQEELGIEGDEIVIDDGTFVDMEIEGFGDLSEARAGLETIALAKSTRSTPRRCKRNGLSFPDASALADAVEQYGDNGFDIMDLDRPSLRPTKKGRKGKLPPELEAVSDDDLREALHGAWTTDRAKKSAKKREREEQRMAGLLGTGGKPDLTAKYREGMTLSQVHEELRLFMLDDDLEAKKFPPMEIADRAALHAIAGRLNLTSKSQGSGKKRFPMLYKTSKTLEYSEAHFSRIIAASSRGFLKNSSYKGKANKFSPAGRGGRGGTSSRGGRGGGVAGHGLRDGEVVGAGAKEISADNFGHRLMEKMGWTKGTALGKDGEGLLVPVAQIMKAGKAGLG